MKMGGETSEDYGTFQNQRVRENWENGQNGYILLEYIDISSEEISKRIFTFKESEQLVKIELRVQPGQASQPVQ